jgi:hypothetical protein
MNLACLCNRERGRFCADCICALHIPELWQEAKFCWQKVELAILTQVSEASQVIWSLKGCPRVPMVTSAV